MPKNSSSLTFKPAALSAGKEWFVFYYVRHPETEKMVRIRHKLNHIKGATTVRRRYADLLIKEINTKLFDGWNPLLSNEAPKAFTPLTEAINLFLRIKDRELRPDSMRSYRSHAHIFKLWLSATGKEKTNAGAFTAQSAVEFMNFLYNKQKMSNRTWNNYRLFLVTLWNWLKEQQMVAANVFSGISIKKNEVKERTVIPVIERDRIKEHLEKTDPDFLLACLLVFHALLRPKEICHLKPENFHLHRQVIHLPGTVTKNRNERYVTISDSLMPYLVWWNFGGCANKNYLFSNGKTPVDARKLSAKWVKIRRELKLPKEYKLYSLRDSGIIQLLQDGISPEEVMRQADHYNLEITSVYVRHASSTAVESIRKKNSKF